MNLTRYSLFFFKVKYLLLSIIIALVLPEIITFEVIFHPTERHFGSLPHWLSYGGAAFNFISTLLLVWLAVHHYPTISSLKPLPPRDGEDGVENMVAGMEIVCETFVGFILAALVFPIAFWWIDITFWQSVLVAVIASVVSWYITKKLLDYDII